MRILHILDHSLPKHSGYVFRTMSIMKAQRALGLDPVLVTAPRHPDAPAGAEIHDGWTIHRTGNVGGMTSRFPVLRELGEMRATKAKLRELVAELKPDILHAHSPVLNAIPAITSGLGLPVVYEIRAFWEDAAVDHGTTSEGSLRYRATRALETWAVRKADAVCVICGGLKDDLIARGISSDKITLIPNAVDIETFPPITAEDSALKASLGLTGKTILGFIGSFYAYEGLDLVVAAMPRLLESHPELALLLVGGGPQDEALKAQVASLGLDDRVVFTGRVPHAEVNRYYSIVDILAYARHKMRLTDLVTPLKPLEAMAQTRIMVASDVGGHRELMINGRGGYLFRADDMNDYCTTVSRLVNEKESWPAMRAAGRHFAETERTWMASVRNYLPVYAKLAGK